MSNDSIAITFNSIPTFNEIDPNDKIIIDTPEGMRTISLKDIRFKNYNCEFGAQVELNTQRLNQINDSFFIAASALVPAQSTTGHISLYYKLDPTLEKEVIIKNTNNFIIPFNFVGANSISNLYPINTSIIRDEGSIFLLPGTYKVRAAVSFVVRNPGRYYEYTGEYAGESYGCNIFLNLAQIDPPERTMLVGDIKYVPAKALKGKTTITSTIDGFFYVCKPTRVALRASTDGNVSLGDGSIDNNVVPKPSLLDYIHYKNITNPAQLMLERLSTEDIYSLLGVSA
jgi:hypothetical protein